MRIVVSVRPSSGREEVVHTSSGEYRVFLKKPAVEGKANAELLKVLKKYFGKPARIVSGARGKKKIIELED